MDFRIQASNHKCKIMKSLNYYTLLALQLGQPEVAEALEGQEEALARRVPMTCIDCEGWFYPSEMSLCYYCGVYRCDKCTELHYGKTMEEHVESLF